MATGRRAAVILRYNAWVRETIVDEAESAERARVRSAERLLAARAPEQLQPLFDPAMCGLAGAVLAVGGACWLAALRLLALAAVGLLGLG